MADQPPQTSAPKQLVLQKIYLKDLSFESPKAPEIFGSAVAPQTQLNMRSSAREVAPNVQEVTLTLTIEAKEKDSTLFLVEVAQAGVFALQGYNAEERSMLIGSYCPGALYPYAREAISDVVLKGGFPPLLLQPINFDALYAQAMQQQRAQPQTAPGSMTAQPSAAQPQSVESGNGAPPSGEQGSQPEAKPAEDEPGPTH